MTPMQIVGLQQASETMRKVWSREWRNRHKPGDSCQESLCSFFRAAEAAGLLEDRWAGRAQAAAPQVAPLHAGEPPPPLQCTLALPEHFSGVLERVLLGLERMLALPSAANVPNPPKPSTKPVAVGEKTKRRPKLSEEVRAAAAERMRKMRREQVEKARKQSTISAGAAAALAKAVDRAASPPAAAAEAPAPTIEAADKAAGWVKEISQPLMDALPQSAPIAAEQEAILPVSRQQDGKLAVAPAAERSAWDEAEDLLAAGVSARQVAQDLDLPLSQVSQRAIRIREERTAARRA